jgi:hypothetical protein
MKTMTNVPLATLFIIVIMLAASVIVIIGFANESHAQRLSAQQMVAFCDPNNPRLKFVNTTESKICTIPPSLVPKPPADMTPIPPTPSVR